MVTASSQLSVQPSAHQSVKPGAHLSVQPGAHYVHPELKGKDPLTISNNWTECQERPLTFYVPDLVNFAYDPLHNPTEADFTKWVQQWPAIPERLINDARAINVAHVLPSSLTTYPQQQFWQKVTLQLYLFDDLQEQLMSDESYKDLRKVFLANTRALATGQQMPFNILEVFGDKFPVMAERAVLSLVVQEDIMDDSRRLLSPKVMENIYANSEEAFVASNKEAQFWKRRLEPGFNVTLEEYIDVKRWSSGAALVLSWVVSEEELSMINLRNSFVQIISAGVAIDNDIFSYFMERAEDQENPFNLVRKHEREGQSELEALQSVMDLRNEQVKMLENMYLYVSEEHRPAVKKILYFYTGFLNYGLSNPRYSWSKAQESLQ
ncbi:hypothetical protein BGZ59_003149 [Podila verticillata]|nr:hypothetical protein BGZ59_003149 [Podila verticillata]KFH64910.1 hypothetical protein MVEG_09638 [Podila verticillata NRRL 6337]